MSLRWKLIALALFIVFFPLFFLNRYAINYFEDYTSHAMENQMAYQAKMLGELYLRTLNQKGGLEFERYMQDFGQEFETHFAILNPAGVALANAPYQVSNTVSFATRPEVVKALAGNYGSATSLSQDHKFMFYHCAMPLERGGKVVAVAWARRNSSRILKALRKLDAYQRQGMWLAMAIGALLASFLSFTLTRPLRRLTSEAISFARGDRKWTLKATGGDEIAALTRAVGKMSEEIEERNTVNREFVEEVVHELRTPLTAVKGAVEILERSDDPVAQQKFLRNISAQTNRSIRMVAQLRDLTRYDAESIRGLKESLVYQDFLTGLRERVQDLCKIELILPREPIHVTLVPDQIEQVLVNLLDNASRFSPADRDVIVSAEIDGNQLVTTVRDFGPGIPQNVIDKIFDRYFSTEATESRENSGLGLSIARSIISNHGGEILAESVEGKGAAITFFLPLD